MGDLERRVRHLERCNRVLGGLAALGGAALLLTGAGQQVPKVYRANQFVVVDGAGRDLAVLGTALEGPTRGGSALTLLGPDGEARAAIRMLATNEVLLELDGQGKSAIRAFCPAKGNPSVMVDDTNGEPTTLGRAR